MSSSLLWKGLPYDYEVEYLESTGTQWIDTGYYPKNHLTEIEEKHYYGYNPHSDSQSAMYGIYTWGCRDNTTFAVWTDYIQLPEKDIRRIVYNSFNEVYIGNGVVKVNGVNVNTYTTNVINLPLPIYLFAWNMRGTPQKSVNLICNYKIAENSVAILDLIPVVKDNIGYMYDKVSGQLFGNSGTGNFIIGPRI